MAPINLPDGTEVSEVILPDGATASKVIAPDGSTVVSAIPDSGLVHRYDWSDGATTTSTVPDLVGSDDLTGSFTDLNATINGLQAGTFDGSGDVVDVTFASSISQPYEVFIVGRLRSTAGGGSFPTLLDGGSNDESAIRNNGTNNDHDFIVNTNGMSGAASANTNARVWSLLSKSSGSTSEGFVDGTQDATGDLGTTSLTGTSVGARPDNSRNAPIDVGEVLIYDQEQSDPTRNDIEQYLADKWGVTV